MAVKLLIADDHELVRKGLVTLLKGAGIPIVGEAENGREAIDKAVELKPDVLLMDVRMEKMDGIAALEVIRKRMPQLPVVMFSAYDNPISVARSTALGAVGFVLKGADRQSLIDAINKASKMQLTKPTGDVSAVDRRRQKRTEDMPLTNREVEVIKLVATGLSNREIGNVLGISIETVKEHVQNILRKLDASDRTQAAVWAIRKGLV